MQSQRPILLLALIIVTYGIFAADVDLSKSTAAPPSSPPAVPQSPAVPPNVNVINTPGVTVVNTPTVRIQEHSWQYRIIVIPKVFPGTPEWNDFLGQLTSAGQQGWELVNIVENTAFLKKSL